MSNNVETMKLADLSDSLKLLEEQIRQGWEKAGENEVLRRLNEGGDLQSIMESIPGIEKSFRELETIDCSDGRVLAGHKMGIAGSGLLLSPEERAAFVARYKGKIKEVTTHRDCGAAALKFGTLKPEEIPAGVLTSDEYGTYCGQKLAEELGAEHAFIGMADMASEYHNERAIVLDQTGQFDSTNLPGFPAHFVCTGAGLGFSEEYMKSEIKTLANIALGHHGFGDRFDEANPFYIIVAADQPEELSRWEAVSKDALVDFGNRVSIKGFLRPTAETAN